MAIRWGQVGLALGLFGLLLMGLMGSDSMNFMLWTWLWPLLASALGLGAGLAAAAGAARRPSRAARVWAAAAVLLSAGTLLAALAGFVGMVAAMHSMPMP